MGFGKGGPVRLAVLSSLKRRFTQVQLTATSGFRVGVKVFRFASRVLTLVS